MAPPCSQNVFLNAYVLGTITILIGVPPLPYKAAHAFLWTDACANMTSLAAAHGKPACAVKHDQKLGTYRERIDNCRQYSAINDVPPVSPSASSWLK